MSKHLSASPKWNPQLVLDIALGTHSQDEILDKYAITETDLDNYYTNPQFKRELIHTRAELAKTGSAFRAHARALAEAHLMTMNELMDDPDTPSNTKVTIWQSLVKFAALEPPKEDAQSVGAKVVIEIANFAQQPPAIDITPL